MAWRATLYLRGLGADVRWPQRPEVRQFIEFYMTEGPPLAAEAGFVPLPERASQLALELFQSGRLGSVFGGVPEVGVTVEELLEREATL